MTNPSSRHSRGSGLWASRAGRALVHALGAGGLLLSGPLLAGCGGNEEQQEEEPEPPPPPPPDPEPERGDPVDMQSLRERMDVDARVKLASDASKATPANESLARAIFELGSAFARLGENPSGSGLRSLLDEDGRSVLDSIQSDLYGLEVEQVRVVYLSPDARSLAEPSQATVVLAFQLANLPSEQRSNVLVLDASQSGGAWTFSPEISARETRVRASAWDGEPLSTYRGEPVDTSAELPSEDGGSGGPGEDGSDGDDGGDGDGGGDGRRNTPAGPVEVPGAG